ncbi:MAG TPA: SWIM zinc finger family protein [Chloroflexota bacterium]|nr:SWIM zinc finger family protein [Chloroflexota bacterium]
MTDRRPRGEGTDGGEWGYRPARRPAQGIRAQTQRGKFGATWWAGRWLAALEALVDPGRLSRGRSYARSGQVVDLDAGRHGVRARVQGSRPTPYEVTMHFRTLSDAEWDAVAEVMAGEALYAARLLSGEMPEEVERAFHAAGASLFPSQAGDLTTDCTCPDWANPCKHVAAVFYLLGERFDADPFLMFELRGRSKDEMVAALRARRAGPLRVVETAATVGSSAPGEAGDTREAPEAPAEPAPLLAEGAPAAAFWSAPLPPDEVTVSFDPPAIDALPVKLLGRPPFWQGEADFMTAMEQAYRAIGQHARRLALEDS